MRAEFKDLKSSTNEINSNTSDIIKTLKKDVSTFSTNDRSINQQISFMYDKFYKNKDKLSEGENNKYYSDKFENISKNINHASNNIENMSHNLDNIISSVTSATNLLGIKLGKDMLLPF
jgi:methyl-accepting chemotaxis protein